MSKGSHPRRRQVDRAEYERRWAETFGRKGYAARWECALCGDRFTWWPSEEARRHRCEPSGRAPYFRVISGAETFDVRDYGAVGGGEHDDTDAIQDAIDALIASAGSGPAPQADGHP